MHRNQARAIGVMKFCETTEQLPGQRGEVSRQPLPVGIDHTGERHAHGTRTDK